MGAPVIVCGKSEQVGSVAIPALKPEYDVIHFVQSREAGVAQIPAILKGEQSVPSDSELGSKDYSRKPVAVIFGGAYEDEDVEVIMAAAAGIHPIPWLRNDRSKPSPTPGTPEYAMAVVARIKELLPQLEKEGKMNEEKVFWY